MRPSLPPSIALGLAALLGAGCAVRLTPPTSLAAVSEESTGPVAPIGGAALTDQRSQLERAHRDLIHFQRTLSSLRDHRERRNMKLFSLFVDGYLGLHLDPLLGRDWPADHPELAALDANLRFMKADVLIRMRETGRAQATIDQISERYRGRGSMLVEYPVGEQRALESALEILRDSKWWGA
jgi:hypothetical protein